MKTDNEVEKITGRSHHPGNIIHSIHFNDNQLIKKQKNNDRKHRQVLNHPQNNYLGVP